MKVPLIDASEPAEGDVRVASSTIPVTISFPIQLPSATSTITGVGSGSATGVTKVAKR
jgi:hypothetical protein